MNALPENTVELHDGHAVTTSLKVAEIFGKHHKNVLRDIEKMGCSTEFSGLNFELAEYLDEQKKPRPMYEISRDGFAFLAMGFTGEKATQFKEAYIKRFNEMEEMLKQGLVKHILQSEIYWFGRYPHWPPVRVLALAGKTYRAIAEELEIKRGRVVRAVNSMFKKGLLDPAKVAQAQRGPARKAAIRYSDGWGGVQPLQMSLDFA